MLLWIIFAKFFVALSTSWRHRSHRRILTSEGCQVGLDANNPRGAWTRWFHTVSIVISFTKSQKQADFCHFSPSKWQSEQPCLDMQAHIDVTHFCKWMNIGANANFQSHCCCDVVDSELKPVRARLQVHICFPASWKLLHFAVVLSLLLSLISSWSY